MSDDRTGREPQLGGQEDDDSPALGGDRRQTSIICPKCGRVAQSMHMTVGDLLFPVILCDYAGDDIWIGPARFSRP